LIVDVGRCISCSDFEAVYAAGWKEDRRKLGIRLEKEGAWKKGSERQARVKLREARFEKRNAR
jgi:hypothetical protein